MICMIVSVYRDLVFLEVCISWIYGIVLKINFYVMMNNVYYNDLVMYSYSRPTISLG